MGFSLCSSSKVAFYLAELTERVAADDRVPIIKASEEKLKVCSVVLIYFFVEDVLRLGYADYKEGAFCYVY